MIGVSGGGGDPRCAFVVEVEAVELILFTDEGSRMLSLPPADSPGGGQYCWLALDSGLEAPPGGEVIPLLCGGF